MAITITHLRITDFCIKRKSCNFSTFSWRTSRTKKISQSVVMVLVRETFHKNQTQNQAITIPCSTPRSLFSFFHFLLRLEKNKMTNFLYSSKSWFNRIKRELSTAQRWSHIGAYRHISTQPHIYKNTRSQSFWWRILWKTKNFRMNKWIDHLCLHH